MKSFLSFLTILLSSLAAISQVTINAQLSHLPARDFRSHWLDDTHVQRRTNLLKRWFANGPMGVSPEQRSLSSPFDTLRSPQQFKGKSYLSSARKFTVADVYRSLGCIDPSEPFQCPQSQRCIALQFICDGHPGDCPGNFDENEETCIAGQWVCFPLSTNASRSSSETSSQGKYWKVLSSGIHFAWLAAVQVSIRRETHQKYRRQPRLLVRCVSLGFLR